jgi:putative phosphoribosyl transferase
MRFPDRRAAGVILGGEIAVLEPIDPLVAALPRGGVPVGYEVANRIGADLDVLVVRKVGAPGHPELAMGAVAEDGVLVRNHDVISMTGAGEERFSLAADRERATLDEAARRYRGDLHPIDPTDRVVIVIDDGLATGATALAAIQSMRQRSVREIWLAAPVAPPSVASRFETVADRVVIPLQPSRFMAVGAWYEDFRQTSDEEVSDLLHRARAAR